MAIRVEVHGFAGEELQFMRSVRIESKDIEDAIHVIADEPVVALLSGTIDMVEFEFLS
jgi:hypothetical protein